MKKRFVTAKERIMQKIIMQLKREAVKDINLACIWWLNQPQVPKNLKSFRKF